MLNVVRTHGLLKIGSTPIYIQTLALLYCVRVWKYQAVNFWLNVVMSRQPPKNNATPEKDICFKSYKNEIFIFMILSSGIFVCDVLLEV